MSRSNRSPAEDAAGRATGPSVRATAGRLAGGVARALRSWWRAAAQTARLAIGIPDYDVYVDHLRRHHPGREPMDRDTFFRERMQSRYARGSSRCC